MFENILVTVEAIKFTYQEGSWNGKEPLLLISTITSITWDDYDIEIIWEDPESMGMVYTLDLTIEDDDEFLWIKNSCGITSEFGEFDWPLWKHCSHPQCHHAIKGDVPLCEDHIFLKF